MSDELLKQDMEKRLWKAAAVGDCKTIRLLAMSGVDIEARNEEGFTAFNIATQKGHSDAAIALLAAKEMQYAMKLGEDPATFFKVPVSERKSA